MAPIDELKKRITMFLDSDVLNFFRNKEGKYQSKINSMLKGEMEHEMNYEKCEELLDDSEGTIELISVLNKHKQKLNSYQLYFIAELIHQYFIEISRNKDIKVNKAYVSLCLGVFRNIINTIQEANRRIDHPEYFLGNLPDHTYEKCDSKDDSQCLQNAIDQTISYVGTEENISAFLAETISRNLKVIVQDYVFQMTPIIRNALELKLDELVTICNEALELRKKRYLGEFNRKPTKDPRVMDENRENMEMLFYRGFHNSPSVCGYYLYQDEKNPIVVIQQVAENRGTSITNLIEDIAFQIYQDRLRAFQPNKIEFYEYYPIDLNPTNSWSRVVFGITSKKGFAEPHWFSLSWSLIDGDQVRQKKDQEKIKFLRSDVIGINPEPPSDLDIIRRMHNV